MIKHRSSTGRHDRHTKSGDEMDLTHIRHDRWQRLAGLIAAALIASSCSSSSESNSSPTSQAEAPTSTSSETAKSTTTVVAPSDTNQSDSLTSTVLIDDAIAASTDWFDVIVYADGGIDGPIVDVSNDGDLWLFGGGAATPVVLNIESREVLRLAQGTTPARISGSGRYVIHALDGDCIDDITACDLAEHERAVVDLATGEAKNLGIIVGPVLISEAGNVIMGALRPTDTPEVRETVDWSGGEVTAVRMLVSELEAAGEITRTTPTLRDLDRTGTEALFTPWLETNTVGGSRYSMLTPAGTVGIAGEELWGLFELGEADLSDDGTFVLIGTQYGLTTIGASDGHRQHHSLEKFGRDVLSFTIAQDRLLAITVPSQRTSGPIELLSFDREAGPFDQSATLLVTIDQSFSLDARFAGSARIHASADGTMAGLSVLVVDSGHPEGASWVSFIIDLENSAENAYIEVAQDGSIAEWVSAQRSDQQQFDRSVTGYLALALDINADLIDHQYIFDRAEAEVEDLGRLWRDAQRHVEALSPPPSLASTHDRWISVLETFANEHDDLGKALATNDPAQTQAATEKFLAAFTSLGAEAAAIDRLQVEATLETLATISTPEAAYVSEVINNGKTSAASVELAFAALGQAPTDPDAAFDQITEALVSLDSQVRELDEIEAPSNAADLHQRRSQALQSTVDILNEINRSLQSGFGSPELVRVRLGGLARQAQVINAAWSRYVADVLRG